MIYSFNDCELDTGLYELRRAGSVCRIEPQVFDLLKHLIENRDRVVTKAELFDVVWNGRTVSDSTLTSRVKSARKALGDNGQKQEFISTVRRRGFRFVPDTEVALDAGADGDGRRSVHQSQDVRFCTTSDGVALAYALSGKGYPIVKTSNWLSHLEVDWRSPIWRHLLHELLANNRLLRYDLRGNGLSDWDVGEFSFEAFLSDLETVVDAAGLDRFVLVGLSQGCAISAAYAARHPGRVSGLILYGGYSRGWKRRGRDEFVEEEEALLALARVGWGRDNPAFRQVFTQLFVPEGSAEEIEAYNELQRVSTSGDNVVRIDRALGEIDVSDMLPDVTAPALVMNCRDDATVPFEEGKRLARLLPNARFVALEGRNHLLLEHEPAWARCRSEIRSFLRNFAA